jgi:hypothetical protein
MSPLRRAKSLPVVDVSDEGEIEQFWHSSPRSDATRLPDVRAWRQMRVSSVNRRG